MLDVYLIIYATSPITFCVSQITQHKNSFGVLFGFFCQAGPTQRIKCLGLIEIWRQESFFAAQPRILPVRKSNLSITGPSRYYVLRDVIVATVFIETRQLSLH